MEHQEHIENLKEKDYITVLSWKTKTESGEIMSPMGPVQIMKVSKNDNLLGDVLQVLAIDYPYLAIDILSGQFEGQTGPLDTRNVKIKKLSKKYADALIKKKSRSESSALSKFPFMIFGHPDEAAATSKPRKKRKKNGLSEPSEE